MTEPCPSSFKKCITHEYFGDKGSNTIQLKDILDTIDTLSSDQIRPYILNFDYNLILTNLPDDGIAIRTLLIEIYNKLEFTQEYENDKKIFSGIILLLKYDPIGSFGRYFRREDY